MRFALLAVVFLDVAACSSGGAGTGSGSTSAGGSGTLCSACTHASDCLSGGNCVFESSSTEGYCAGPCLDSTCPESNAMCFNFNAGQGDLYCYPTTRTCVGYTPGGSTGTTSTTSGSSGTAGATTGATGTSSSSSSGGNACASDPDTYANFGQTFMTTYCLPCHAPSSPAYFPPDCTTQAGIQGDLAKVLSSINGGLMPLWPDAGFPPNSQALISASDLTRVEAWLTCGAP